MKLLNVLLFALLLLPARTALADASPFKRHATIVFDYKKDIPEARPIGIVYFNRFVGRLDTATECKGDVCVYMENGTMNIKRHIPDTFRVLVQVGDHILTSPDILENGLNTYSVLRVSSDEIKDVTPLFKVPYSAYFLAFFATMIIEIIVALVFFALRKISFVYIRYIIFCNVITHPLLWLFSAYYIGFGTGMLLGEVLVFITEALLLWRWTHKHINLRQSFMLSGIMNTMSFFLGGLIYEIFARF